MGLLPLVTCTLLAARPWLVVPADAEQPSESASEIVVKQLTQLNHPSSLAPANHPARACANELPAAQPSCFLQAAPAVPVLLVTGAALRDRFALTIAVLAKDGTVLEEAGNRGALTDVEAVTIATVAKLEKAVQLREASDAPVAVTLVPREREPVAAVTAAPPSRAPAWVATGVTVAAAAVAVSFLAVGLSQKGTLEGAQDGTLRHSQAVELQRNANTNLSVALGTGLGAAAGGVLSAVLWGTTP